MKIHSSAIETFNENMKDVDRLLTIHRDLSGDSAGRKHGVQVLNKAAILLITACWEAFCEDLCRQAVLFLLGKVEGPNEFPSSVRWTVARRLRADKNESRVWSLAGDGWKNEVLLHCDDLLARFNTPKSAKIDDLYRSAVGIDRISQRWYWAGMSAAQARKKLDRYVEMRGALAHLGKGSNPTRKNDVVDYEAHVSRLLLPTAKKIACHIRDQLGLDRTRMINL